MQFIDLKAQYRRIKDNVDARIAAVLELPTGSGVLRVGPQPVTSAAAAIEQIEKAFESQAPVVILDIKTPKGPGRVYLRKDGGCSASDLWLSTSNGAQGKLFAYSEHPDYGASFGANVLDGEGIFNVEFKKVLDQFGKPRLRGQRRFGDDGIGQERKSSHGDERLREAMHHRVRTHDSTLALDQTGKRVIAVAPVPCHGLGEAINDRLSRAAAPRG